MMADEAQALVARCLVDPSFLDAGAGVSAPLHDHLQLFRGFIARIKQAQLRRIAPLTLRLMALHGLDISFFAEAAPGYLRARATGPLTDEDLFARFEKKLIDHLLSLPSCVRIAVGSMIRHEARIWRCGRAVPRNDCAPHPRLRSGVAVERFEVDVLVIAAALRRDRFAAPAVPVRDAFVLYDAGMEATCVTEIDALGAWLLSRLDGAAEPAGLADELSAALGADASGVVADLMADASAKGLLDAGAA